MLQPPFQLATSTTIIHGLTTNTDAKPLMLTLFIKTHIATPPFEFLVIRVIVIIYTGDFYLVYLILFLFTDFVLFIYVPNINDVRNGR